MALIVGIGGFVLLAYGLFAVFACARSAQLSHEEEASS